MARKPLAVFLILLFCSFFLFDSIVLGSHELEYRIDVQVDGSAGWVIEHRFLLESEEDEMMFKQYSNWTYFSEYLIKNIKSFVNSVSLKTTRNMTAENFKMTVDVFDSYRVVRYEFDWISFAEEAGSHIKIGDVFELEGLFLYGDGTLNMTYPTDYIVEIVSPPDFVGKSLRELDIRAKHGINVIAIKRKMKSISAKGEAKDEEKIEVTPKADEIIRAKDILVIIGPNDKIENLKKKH